MKKAWNIVFFIFFTLCLFLFKPRQDVIFTAVDRTQYIRLFETGQDFELCLEEDHVFTGTYVLSKDTVFLNYRKRPESSARKWINGGPAHSISLPKKLYINNPDSHITSTDQLSFSAVIHTDMRKKLVEAHESSILAATHSH